MTVLMFGWEFPPHISGGLGTACLGLATALMEQDVKLFFVVPRAQGDEPITLIDASQIPVGGQDPFVRSSREEHLSGSRLIAIPASIAPYSQHVPFHSLEAWNWRYLSEEDRRGNKGRGVHYAFRGGYGPALLEEIQRYAVVAAEIARQYSFDVIHAHDWLTFLAGMEAKTVSGKPLIVHVHATEVDRAGKDHLDERIFAIEQRGMLAADVVIAVSHWTKNIITQKYGIAADKVHVVHNGVAPAADADFPFIPRIGDYVVTFLGRVTHQKGPQYFVDAARKVLDYFPDTHFIMAGSGDLLTSIVERAARSKISSRLHFTGFLEGEQIHQVWSVTDVYVMPSVSEPFGITPLEAVQAGVPVIVSNQSGVAEVMDHAIKVDFWDTDALANAIISVFRHKGLSAALKLNGQHEIKTLTWKRAAKRINQLYHEI